MKKVLFVATVTSHIRGFHIPYLKWFKEQGYEVHVASNGSDKIEYCDKHFNLPFNRFPFKKENIKVYKELKKIVQENKYEIIHCHTPVGSVIARLSARKERKKGTKVIYTAHGFHFFKGAPIKNWLMYYPIEKLMAKYTDCLITINKEDYEFAKKHLKAKQIELVNGVGVDEDKFNIEMIEDEKIQLRKKLGLTKNDFVIIYAAELSKRKNQGMLLNAVKELKQNGISNIKVLLAGNDSLNEKYKQMAKQLEINEDVFFLGYRKDVPQLMKISNLVVSTSKQEGLPVNIMEAMISGLPIIATNCRGNRDLVINNETGYIVEIDDEKQLSKKIQELINDKELMEKFGKNAQKKIDIYKLKNVMKVMEKIYNNIINKNILIIPSCSDLNRGDQALVLETRKIIQKVYGKNTNIYMMSDNCYSQCENFGLKIINNILEHPSRVTKRNNENNINYENVILKWGLVALGDYITSKLILNNITRFLIFPFLNNKKKESIQVFKKCDAFFVKGGGFLHDYSGGPIGIYTIYYHLFNIKLSLKMKKPVYIMPNSFGPFKSKITKRMVNKVLDKCEFVTARESISAGKETNGLDRDIELFPDLAFFLNTKEESRWNEIKSINNLESNKKYVAITVRPYRFYNSSNPKEKYEDYKNTFIKFVEYLNEKGYTPLFVVHTRAINNHEDDATCIKEITETIEDKTKFKIIDDESMDCYDLKEIYGKCFCTIGTRFHSVIFTIEQKIPCIAITYGGNKGNGIMKDMKLEEYAIKIEELSIEKLKIKFEELEKNKNDIINKIENYILEAEKKYKQLIEKINGGNN